MSAQIAGCEGKTYVIAGAGGRIGRSLVTALLDKGANVIGLDKSFASTRPRPTKPFFEAQCDLLDTHAVQNAIEHGVKEFGRLDGGVFAAYPRTTRGFEDFENLSVEGLRDNLLAHLGSHLLFAQTILSSAEGQSALSIVFLGSIQGVSAPKFLHYEGTNMSSPIEYTVAKTSLVGAARWLSARYGAAGHRFNVLSPGGVVDGQPESFQKSYRSSTLFKGLLDPTDLANPIIFLLSGSSSFITGQNLIVDDGWSL